MVTDVTYLCSVMSHQQTDPKSTPLITRDLLGGCTLDSSDSSQELDLDLHVPPGYQKQLDLTSGKVYLRRCKSPTTPSSDHKQQHTDHQTVSNLQDLNFLPTSKKPLNLFDDTSLDLNLVCLSSSSPPAYRSVCTLDKVKFALERAERETINKRSVSIPKSCSSPTSNSSSSVKETMFFEDEERSFQAYAAGCPSCLLYVLISRSNPRCPRCNMNVPSPTSMKKPRIDLNISI